MPRGVAADAGRADHPVLEELRALDVDGLTPRDALNLVSEWKKKLE